MKKCTEIIYKRKIITNGYYYKGDIEITTYIKRTVIKDRSFMFIFPLKDKVIYKIEQICPYLYTKINTTDPLIQCQMQEEYQKAKLWMIERHKIDL